MPTTRSTAPKVRARFAPEFTLAAIPFVCALVVWLTPLSFVPVPWPDDSAFYFVAHELFKWPPRFVMLPQAPFEPTYRIFNFNTMPFFPILIGLGRLVGVDGSFALKLWPLSFWAATGALVSVTLYRKGLPFFASILLALGFGLDPELRWASVLIRPESLIGLVGAALLLGIAFGFPKKLEARGRFWDPVAALLALGAYTHFNSIHLVFPVVAAIATAASDLRSAWRSLVRTGALTLLYLVPYFGAIALHPRLYVQQMTTQWSRLAVGNNWLDSLKNALEALFQSMGSPIPFSPLTQLASGVLWLLIALAALLPLLALALPRLRAALLVEHAHGSHGPNPLPAAVWLLSACWLWHSKPEVWFVYYIHVAALFFAGILALRLRAAAPAIRPAPAATLAALVVIFAWTDVEQLKGLSHTDSWTWDSYHALIDCIDRRLVRHEAELGHPRPFRVWDPTFPDITVELSRRHPDWEFSRTNDFWDRRHLAIRHGHEVEAVVVPETVNFVERRIDAPMRNHPGVQSVWMTWNGYFLKQLWDEPGWKPERHLCQIGRWQAFLFMNPAQ